MVDTVDGDEAGVFEDGEVSGVPYALFLVKSCKYRGRV